MRKQILFLLFVAIVSCKEISYKAPQPKGKKALSTIPASLWGSYVITGDKENTSDTLIVYASGYEVLSERKQKMLGDSLVLKSYKGYYFVNINERPEWLLRIIKVEKDGSLTFMSMNTSESSFNNLMKRLTKEVRVDSVDIPHEKLYQIDPTPKELLKLIKKGFFSETVRMQKLK